MAISIKKRSGFRAVFLPHFYSIFTHAGIKRLFEPRGEPAFSFPFLLRLFSALLIKIEMKKFLGKDVPR